MIFRRLYLYMYLHVLRLAHMCMHVHACNSHDPNIVILKLKTLLVD